MSKLKFYPNCGSEIKSNERFCGHWSFDTESLENAEAEGPKRENTSVPENHLNSKSTQVMRNNLPLQTHDSNEKDGSKKVLIIVVAVLATLLFIAAMLFWWFSYGYQILNKEGGSISEENNQGASSGFLSIQLIGTNFYGQ